MQRRKFIYTGGGWVVGGLAAISSLGFISAEENDITPYKIIKVRCNGCQHCLRPCREKAISLVKGKAFIDPKKCKGCGDCVRSCRRQAIATEKKD